MSEVTKSRLFAIAIIIAVGVMAKFCYDNKAPGVRSFGNKYQLSQRRP